MDECGVALMCFLWAGAIQVQPHCCAIGLPRTSIVVMEGIAAAFVTGVAVGLGLGYRLCPSRAPQPDIRRVRDDPDVEHRRRRDIPTSSRGGACTDWQYQLTPVSGLDEGVRTTTWRSMAWGHSEVLEVLLAEGESQVEICSADGKAWIVNFERMEQRSTSSSRVRPVRRRLLGEE